MVVADDRLLGVEHLAHLHGDLCLLEALGQVLHIGNGRADAHNGLDVMLAVEGVHNAGGQLFDVVLVDAALDLLDEDGVVLADVEHEVLLLIGEQAAYDVVGGNVRARGNADEQHHAGHVRCEMQLARLGIDIAGQDIVQHHILDKVRLVELFVVVLLDVLQADGQQRRIAQGGLVGSLHQNGIIVALVRTEQMIGVAVPHERVAGCQPVGRDAVPHLADAVQVRTGDDGARFIDNAHHAVDRIFHLIDNALKNSVRHNTLFPSVLRRSACAQL